MVLPFIMIFIATRMRGLNNIIHECTHSSFTNNKILGRIAAAIVFTSFESYRKEHISHHINQGTIKKI
jgi:fatty acid desaturase